MSLLLDGVAISVDGAEVNAEVRNKFVAAPAPDPGDLFTCTTIFVVRTGLDADEGDVREAVADRASLGQGSAVVVVLGGVDTVRARWMVSKDHADGKTTMARNSRSNAVLVVDDLAVGRDVAGASRVRLGIVVPRTALAYIESSVTKRAKSIPEVSV